MLPVTLKRERTALYEGINEALYDWYLSAMSNNIHPDESVFKAKEIPYF